MIIYQAIFYLLMFEVFLCLVFFSPLPIRLRKFLQAKLYNAYGPWAMLIRRAIRGSMVVVFLLFLDACRTIRKHHLSDDHVNTTLGPLERTAEQVQVFRAQRNFYLTFSVLFLCLVLDRFFAQASLLVAAEEANAKLTVNHELLKKQAGQMSKAFTEGDAKVTKLSGVSTEDDDIKNVQELKTRLAATREELAKAQKRIKDLEASVLATGDVAGRLKEVEVELEKTKLPEERKKNK